MKVLSWMLLLWSFSALAQVQNAAKILDYYSKGVSISPKATNDQLKNWDVSEKDGTRILTRTVEDVDHMHGGFSFTIPKGSQKIIIDRRKDGSLKGLSQLYKGYNSDNGKKSKVLHYSGAEFDPSGKMRSYSFCRNKGGLATCSTVTKPYCEALIKAYGKVLPTRTELKKTKECVSRLDDFSKKIQQFRTLRNDGYEYEELVSDSKKVEEKVKKHLGAPTSHLNLDFEKLNFLDEKVSDLMAVSRSCDEFFRLSEHSYDTVQRFIKAKAKKVNGQ